jgi:hypothetical protein
MGDELDSKDGLPCKATAMECDISAMILRTNSFAHELAGFVSCVSVLR